jgi:hypothetical protein
VFLTVDHGNDYGLPIQRLWKVAGEAWEIYHAIKDMGIHDPEQHSIAKYSSDWFHMMWGKEDVFGREGRIPETVLFETMVFQGDSWREMGQGRADTYEEALAMHRFYVDQCHEKTYHKEVVHV